MIKGYIDNENGLLNQKAKNSFYQQTRLTICEHFKDKIQLMTPPTQSDVKRKLKY